MHGSYVSKTSCFDLNDKVLRQKEECGLTQVKGKDTLRLKVNFFVYFWRK